MASTHFTADFNTTYPKDSVLLLYNDVKRVWKPHLFRLKTNKLIWSTKNVDSETAQQADQPRGGDDDDSIAGNVRIEEMHYTEEWYHGDISRREANTRLMKHATEGMFLVRDSDTFPGDFAISFYAGGAVRLMRVKTADHSESTTGRKYYMEETHMKDTIYELIMYHQKNALMTRADGRNIRVLLAVPCPHPKTYLERPWYNGAIDKTQADALLDKVREDGAFLVRSSAADPSVFVVSWRANGVNQHYRLKTEGRVFFVNQTMFESLTQLVDYYRNHEFTAGICLNHPVNEQIANETESERSHNGPHIVQRPGQSEYVEVTQSHTIPANVRIDRMLIHSTAGGRRPAVPCSHRLHGRHERGVHLVLRRRRHHRH